MQKNKIRVPSIEVYTDGSYISDDKCGYGIYYGNNVLPSVSRKFKGGEPSNNRAELQAILHPVYNRVGRWLGKEQLENSTK